MATSNLDSLISTYKSLESLYEEFMEVKARSYKLQYALRSALKGLKSPLPIPYPKYSSQARRLARKALGKKRGYEVEHLVALKFLWNCGVSIERANDKRNLVLLKKKDNRRKSFKVDWDIFKLVYEKELK